MSGERRIAKRKVQDGESTAEQIAACQRLADHRLKHADVYSEEEILKEDLRQLAILAGHGFTVRLRLAAQTAVITVSKQVVREFRGLVVKLVDEAWLGLTVKRQQKLLEDGLVAEEESWSDARSPSITFKLI